jgi:hypothetical protein
MLVINVSNDNNGYKTLAAMMMTGNAGRLLF